MALLDQVKKLSYLDLRKDADLVENEIRSINENPRKILFTLEESRLTEENYKKAFQVDKELVNSNLKFKFPTAKFLNEVDDDYFNPVIVIVE